MPNRLSPAHLDEILALQLTIAWVPHLDTRWVDGEKELLFGPYAGFTTKFLKRGSYLDLFRSIGFDNIGPVLSAGIDNIDLTREVRETTRARLGLSS